MTAVSARPVEIVPGLHWLAGVGWGANAYLWWPIGHADSSGPLLFDCGWPWSGSGLAQDLSALGCRLDCIRHIAITHDDVDHAGRLASLQAVSGAEVIAHELEAPRLARDRWRYPSGNAGRANAVGLVTDLLNARWPHRAVQVGRRVVQGDTLPGGWVSVHTPGHTPGHTSYFHPRLGVLLAGDALGPPRLSAHLRPPARIYTEDSAAAARSVCKLAALEPQILCFGHGPVLFDAAGKLRELAASL